MELQKKNMCGWLLAACLLFVTSIDARAQEHVAPILRRFVAPAHTAAPVANKGTALTLPFFEDFTDYSPYPNSARWTDSEAYINNTMGVQPIARGVATLDALNAIGRPYDTTNPFFVRYGDSLTSQQLNLSSYSATDNIYLSFFYQPQGNGFSPDNGDSLILYFHRSNGGWEKVWSVNGSTLQPFTQVLVPVTDPGFFAPDFQFRFVNIISINSNDDVWNLDYIRMDVNRNASDTLVRDLAFTSDPTYLLNDYTSMPYKQFVANAAAERASAIGDSLSNHHSTTSTITYGYTARETSTGTALGSGATTANFPPFAIQNVAFPAYTTVPGSLAGKIVFENKFYLQSGQPNEPKANDTSIREQIFDNYLAYDDGTAEKSYYLNLTPTLPGKIAIEYHLNVPDTLRGMAVYFGQQVPSAYYKLFTIDVYKTLLGVNNSGTESKYYSEDNFQPLYVDSVNGFTIYKFAQPVLLPAGIFYMGTTQPANSGSDSLYIGYDANRVGGNHLYYNVYGSGTTWQGSLFTGALMIRPILGSAISGTGISTLYGGSSNSKWTFYPNPAIDAIQVALPENAGQQCTYTISDMLGKVVAAGAVKDGDGGISLSSLSSGVYVLLIKKKGVALGAAQKLIKQ